MRVTRLRVAAIASVLFLSTSLGCTDVTSTSPVGKLSARVVDASGAGVQGVAADLYKYVEGGALLWRASSTSSNGIAVFGASDGGVVAGSYYVHVSFINSYRLASGETNDKPVTVMEGDDLVVTFQAVSDGPSQ